MIDARTHQIQSNISTIPQYLNYNDHFSIENSYRRGSGLRNLTTASVATLSGVARAETNAVLSKDQASRNRWRNTELIVLGGLERYNRALVFPFNFPIARQQSTLFPSYKTTKDSQTDQNLPIALRYLPQLSPGFQ